jgi:hypothetical protein
LKINNTYYQYGYLLTTDTFLRRLARNLKISKDLNTTKTLRVYLNNGNTLSTATLFVFFAAPARTGIVYADLLSAYGLNGGKW